MESHRREHGLKEEEVISSMENNPVVLFFYANKTNIKAESGPFIVGEKIENDPRKICPMLPDQHKLVFSTRYMDHIDDEVFSPFHEVGGKKDITMATDGENSGPEPDEITSTF